MCPVCNAEVGRRPRGRPRYYCSPRCRQAAYRERRTSWSLDPLPTEQVSLIPSIKTAGTDEPVAQAILEARMVTGALLRPGTVARPQLAWRCAKAGAELRDSLEKYFPFG